MPSALIASFILHALAVRADPGIWTASSWSSCSSPCSFGTAYRQVQCRSRITNQISSEDDCSAADRPPTTRFCSSPECQWGCSPDLLQPICLTASLKQVPDGFCSQQTRPGDFTDDFQCPYGQPDQWQPPELCEDCASSPPSYSWTILTPFSSCSPSCGSNRFSWRQVVCANSSGGVVDAVFCPGPAPPDRQPCLASKSCSVYGGRCRNGDGDEVADHWCFNETGIYGWSIESDWSSCSSPAWMMRTRRVSCLETACPRSQQPASIMSCPGLPLAPFTYRRVGRNSALCTTACGPGRISSPYQCRLQDLDVDDEYCHAAGVAIPPDVPCKTPHCLAKKPCDLYARLNISVPIGAFVDDHEIGRQLQLDLEAALPNATSVVVSRIRTVSADQIEAEFAVSCPDGYVSAGDIVELQISDPDSAFRRGILTRGSGSRLEILSAPDQVVVKDGGDAVSRSNDETLPSIRPTNIYIALAVFVIAFLLIRYAIRKMAGNVKGNGRISTLFAVQALDQTEAGQNIIKMELATAMVQQSRRNSAVNVEQSK